MQSLFVYYYTGLHVLCVLRLFNFVLLAVILIIGSKLIYSGNSERHHVCRYQYSDHRYTSFWFPSSAHVLRARIQYS